MNYTQCSRKYINEHPEIHEFNTQGNVKEIAHVYLEETEEEKCIEEDLT